MTTAERIERENELESMVEHAFTLIDELQQSDEVQKASEKMRAEIAYHAQKLEASICDVLGI